MYGMWSVIVAHIYSTAHVFNDSICVSSGHQFAGFVFCVYQIKQTGSAKMDVNFIFLVNSLFL